MASSIKDLLIRIITKYDDKGTKDAKKDLFDIEKFIQQLGFAVGAKETFDFLKESVNLAREQAMADAQLAAAIKSTGAAAGLTVGELKGMASELQNVTNFGDEATEAHMAVLYRKTPRLIQEVIATWLKVIQAEPRKRIA